MSGNQGHGDIVRPDLVDELMDFLFPVIVDLLQRLDGDEFTTVQFIALMQSDPHANEAYREALRRWGENEHSSKMVIHGQVIPGVLRRSELVDWNGYAHGENDVYAVPAWWSLRT